MKVFLLIKYRILLNLECLNKWKLSFHMFSHASANTHCDEPSSGDLQMLMYHLCFGSWDINIYRTLDDGSSQLKLKIISLKNLPRSCQSIYSRFGISNPKHFNLILSGYIIITFRYFYFERLLRLTNDSKQLIWK